MCGEEILDYDEMVLHRKTHKQYPCSRCTKTFQTAMGLRLHTHSDERSFACTLCDYNAAQNSTLKTHMLTHAAPAFRCELCDYSARQQLSLTTHMLQHTGDRPFVCPVCDKAFFSKNACTHHERIHV